MQSRQDSKIKVTKITAARVITYKMMTGMGFSKYGSYYMDGKSFYIGSGQSVGAGTGNGNGSSVSGTDIENYEVKE